MAGVTKIVLDAGHGLPDSGAVNKNFGWRESNIALAITQELSRQLKGAGYDVKNTRNTHTDTPAPDNKSRDLSQRAAIANAFGADIFISIHLNGAINPEASGFECWRQTGKASKLADAVYASVKTNMSDSFKMRGVKTGNFAVLRGTHMPSVLIECGFITNDTEAYLLNTPSFQKRLSEAIKYGVEAYATGI